MLHASRKVKIGIGHHGEHVVPSLELVRGNWSGRALFGWASQQTAGPRLAHLLLVVLLMSVRLARFGVLQVLLSAGLVRGEFGGLGRSVGCSGGVLRSVVVSNRDEVEPWGRRRAGHEGQVRVRWRMLVRRLGPWMEWCVMRPRLGSDSHAKQGSTAHQRQRRATTMHRPQLVS